MAQKEKILVVEDDPLTGTDLVNTLTGFGYSVVGPITSGEEVIKKIDAIAPDFILMDINLNGAIDGIQATQEIQKKRAIPVVFLSALDDETILQRAKLTNPYGYIIKPFDKAELKLTIELTLQRFSQETKNKGSKDLDTHSEINFEGETEAENILGKHKLFKEISPKSIKKLASASRIAEVNASEYIMMEGEPLVGAFLPLTGRISVTKTSSSGKELIVALMAPGDVYGLISWLPGLIGAVSARAQIDSRVLWMPKAEWEEMIQTEPQIYQNLCHCLADRLASAHTLSSSLAHARVEARIISTLLALLPEFGKGTSKEGNEGRIYITRKELSELTGTTPETAIRVTKALERQQLLDLTRPGIIKIPNIQLLSQAIEK